MDKIQVLWGAAKSGMASMAGTASMSSAAPADADFADFATAAPPSPPPHAASSAFSAASTTAAPLGGLFAPGFGLQGRPYTKWYRVWERVTIADFYQELILLPVLIGLILLHLWGSRANQTRAKQWAATHLPLLEAEFASVGFGGGGGKAAARAGDVAKAMAAGGKVPETLLRQNKKNEYITYASGRQNVAYVDVKLSLLKRYSPFAWLGEAVLSFFFDSIPAPTEQLEATAACFDGKERSYLPDAKPGKDSSYDGFVWAIVHKDQMKKLRDDRYDLSLTATRDSPKLPEWLTVMSENAEITDVLLTPDLVKAVTEAGEDLQALIVTDQPVDAPKKLDDLIPQKRVYLNMKLDPRSSAASSLFAAFLRLPDALVASAHFRPEAMRKIRATRDEEARKIRKSDEEEKEKERREKGDKMKKEERERKLKGMSGEEQRKFLDKEREQDRKKGMKRQSTKG